MNVRKPDDEFQKPFHSNGYAEVANGGLIGSTNAQTFRQRYRVDQNRRVVRGYRDSYIGQGVLQSRRDTLRPSTPPTSRSIVSLPQRPAFKEPPRRGFNPFS